MGTGKASEVLYSKTVRLKLCGSHPFGKCLRLRRRL